jgi:hypothetical protein
MDSRLRPKTVLWWGVGLTLGGMLLTLLLPPIGYSLAGLSSGASGVDQGLLGGLDLVVRLIGQVVPPLGVALIGASVVMAFVAQRLPLPTPTGETAAPVEES